MENEETKICIQRDNCQGQFNVEMDSLGQFNYFIFTFICFIYFVSLDGKKGFESHLV